jgi:hypothetical protein
MVTVKDGKFNFWLMCFIVIFSSTIVALGVHDLNKYYVNHGRQLSPAEAEKLIWNMHGRIDWDQVAQDREDELRKASYQRQQELGSVKRFLKSLLP